MKNFGLKELYFSGKAFKPEEKAFECAAHAVDVLEEATHLGEKAVNEVFDVLIGTTSKSHDKDNSPRKAISPQDLKKRLVEIKGDAALMLGREDTGLVNDELDKCDLVVCIPASSDYNTLNISHAAAILFYELTGENEITRFEARVASGKEKEALLKRLVRLLDSVGYPNYKKKVTERIFRKVIGRAGISSREAHTLAGVFKEANFSVIDYRSNCHFCYMGSSILLFLKILIF
jgi:TrmH family RNA methyltransferase